MNCRYLCTVFLCLALVGPVASGDWKKDRDELRRLLGDKPAKAEVPAKAANAGQQTMPVDELEDRALADLVQDSVNTAEAASERAGVAYYARDRSGILGNKVWYADIGMIGEVDFPGGSLGAAPVISTGFNKPAGAHVDFGLGLTYARQSGQMRTSAQVPTYHYYPYYYTTYRTQYYYDTLEVETLAGGLSMYLSVAPGSVANPFVGLGWGFVNVTGSSGGYFAGDTGTGYALTGGIEFAGRKSSFVPSVVHSKSGDTESTSLGALFSYWYAFRHAFRLGVGYDVDSEGYDVSIGWMYSR